MPANTSTHRISLRAIALNTEGATAPDWIELIPAGANVVGVDGRSWKNPAPQAVVDASDAPGLPLPIDWEHGTQVKAPKGEEAPAAAWIEELQVRDGAIWGRVEWTPRAREQVTNREYRFFSPAFQSDRATGVILRLVGGGLTNTPNLHLAALNREEPHREQSETPLDLATRLRQALGLAADATDDTIVSAATTAVALNKSGVDMAKFAPRSDLETAVNRADAAEAKLRERDERDHAAAIDTALAAAQAAGKITPASRDSYLAMCKAEGGLDRFKSLVATLPVIASAQTIVTDKEPDTAKTGEHGLTETDLAVCRQLGQDPAEYAKGKEA